METAKQAVHTVSSALGYGPKDKNSDSAATADTSSHPAPAAAGAAGNDDSTTSASSGDTSAGNVSQADASPAVQQPSRTAEGGAHDAASRSHEKHSDLGNDLEHTLSGPKDPALEGEEHPKMTGQGAPGSHSAIFGLTPDGKKHG